MTWETVAIGDVCTIVGGGTPKSEVAEYWDGDLNWLTPKEMGRLVNREISSTERKITDKGLKNSSAKLLPINSVILSSRAPIGHLAINKVLMGTNQGCKGLIPSSKLNYEYLYYFLYHSKQMLNDMGSGATFKELSGTKLATVQMPLPPLSIQNKVVAKLDSIFSEMNKVNAAAENNAVNAEALFQSYLTEMFERSGKDWALDTLGNYYDVRDGTHDSPKFYDDGYPLVTSKNLKNGQISFEKIQYVSEEDYLSISQRSGVKKGDVLMAMIGTIGNPVVIETDSKFAIKNVALFKTNDKQSPHFLRYYLGSDYVINKMEKDAKGATQKFVGLGYLRSFPIKIPSLEKQLEVVTILDLYEQQTNNLVNTYKKKIKQLEILKHSIFQQAFNGELVRE